MGLDTLSTLDMYKHATLERCHMYVMYVCRYASPMSERMYVCMYVCIYVRMYVCMYDVCMMYVCISWATLHSTSHRPMASRFRRTSRLSFSPLPLEETLGAPPLPLTVLHQPVHASEAGGFAQHTGAVGTYVCMYVCMYVYG